MILIDARVSNQDVRWLPKNVEKRLPSSLAQVTCWIARTKAKTNRKHLAMHQHRPESVRWRWEIGFCNKSENFHGLRQIASFPLAFASAEPMPDENSFSPFARLLFLNPDATLAWAKVFSMSQPFRKALGSYFSAPRFRSRPQSGQKVFLFMRWLWREGDTQICLQA